MMKRLLDVAGAGIGLLLLSPLFLLVAVWIRLGDRGPAFFGQNRCGQDGQLFRMWKFRSMLVDAEAQGAQITVGADHRITPIGRILRQTKLDELPQLWNVLRGEMSLVGPRPEVPRYVDIYSPTERAVLKLKPGITDPASFAFINESEILAGVRDPENFYRAELLPAKIRLNLEYAARANFGRDLFLILATIAKIAGIKLNVFTWLGLTPPTLGSFR